MRLTLRTLLAYLDDILEPAQANEIGKKLQNAPVAQELVTRIREVVRRRRLKAPTLTGPESGLDPNMVAEYIDNQQTPAQVTQTERILLSSDVHLAETASSHQILTLVLGEPVEVLPDSRKRMYALGPVAPQDQLQVPAEQTEGQVSNGTRNGSSASAASVEKRAVAVTAKANAKPAVVTAPPVANERRWPAVAVAVLAFVWLGLQFGDSNSVQAPKNDPAEANQSGLAAATKPAEQPAAESTRQPGEDDAASPQVSAGPSATDKGSSPIKTGEPVIAANEGNAPSVIDAPPPPDAVEPTPPANADIAAVPGPGATGTNPLSVVPAPEEPAENASDSVAKAAASAAADSTTTAPKPGEPTVAASEPPESGDANAAMPGEPSAPKVNQSAAENTVATAPAPPSDPENMTPEPAAGDTAAVPSGLEVPKAVPKVENISGPPTGAMAAAPPAPAADAAKAIEADTTGPVAPPKAPESNTAAMSYGEDAKGILLQHHDDHWFVVTPGYGIAINTRVASPRPYLSELTMANLPVKLHLAGGTRLRVLPPRDGVFAVQLETGRAIFSRPADEAEGVFKGKAVNVVVVVGEKSWTVTVPPTEARVAIEATPVPPVRLETLTDSYPFKVWAIGSLGEITAKPAGGDAQPVTADARLTLAAPEPGKVLAEPGVSVEWLAGGEDPVAKWLEGPVAPTDKRDATRFGKELDPTGPVSDSLPSLVESSKSWMSRRATQCLSLTEDYQVLVRTLAIAEHDEAIAEAVHGLRTWLAGAPDRGPLLKRELQQEFPADDAETIYQLLWGFDETHARDMKTSRDLVRWLSSNRPIIQRLAYFHILRVTGTQDSYRVSLTRDRLNSFRKKWQRQITRGDGKLLND